MKTCRQCLEPKPLADFYALPHTHDKLNYRCIPCQNAYNREYNRKKSIAGLNPVFLAMFPNGPELSVIRFARKIDIQESGCWKWTGNLHPDNGYPRVWFGKHDDKLAHRVAYEWAREAIAEGMTIDHLCRNRWCVNPKHLEVVSRGENNLRGNSPWAKNGRKTHCHAGHEFSPENTYNYHGMRHCKTCSRLRKKNRRQAQLAP